MAPFASNASEPDAIRARMSQVRTELHSEVGELRHKAKQATDWKFYLKNYPIASAATAAAVGYLVMPRRPKVVKASVEDLQAVAQADELVVSDRSDVKVSSNQGIGTTLLTLAATAGVRALMAYAGKELGGKALVSK